MKFNSGFKGLKVFREINGTKRGRTKDKTEGNCQVKNFIIFILY